MSVKWHNHMSDPKDIFGGGAQGGTLGILEFLSQNNDSADMVSNGPDVDEDKLIAEKSEIERKYILKHKSLFSEKLSPSRHLDSPSCKLV